MRLVKHLPKPLLVLLIILILSVTAYGAYLIMSITAEVTIEEPITVSPTAFTMEMYPGESEMKTITINNDSSVALHITLHTYSSPKGLTITVPNQVTVPGGGSTTFNIMVKASVDTIPDTYTVTVGVSR